MGDQGGESGGGERESGGGKERGKEVEVGRREGIKVGDGR